MSETTSQWGMLKDALRSAIEELDGYRVTDALFTTYAFEPEFFETAILPLLQPDGGDGLSLHSAVRHLQMESLLRDSPINVAVYFDARVVVAGCPMLAYEMLPMRLQHEFHGKVMLLRLENGKGLVRWVLGAGSANLTKAGWWENIECWYFAPAFDPAKPPAGVVPGLVGLLSFLTGSGARNSVAAMFRKELSDSSALRRRSDEPLFQVFVPGKPSFIKWFDEIMKHKVKQSDGVRVEVFSPYFADAGHAELVQLLLNTTGAKALDLWLPEDPWQAAGGAAQIEEDAYCALRDAANLRWCEFGDADLAGSRRKEETPRFFHAKVIRIPGQFCFMGSVNFSNKAFKLNFEAGFLFPDKGDAWLTDLSRQPIRFLKPLEPATHADVVETGPNIFAIFNWHTLELGIDFVTSKDRRRYAETEVRLIDAQGKKFGRATMLPHSFKLKTSESLYRDLQSNPWIKVEVDGVGLSIVWVQQCALDHRPPPEDLRPDVWRILEMWRSLAAGGTGSCPGDYEQLEVLLLRRGASGETPPAGSLELDIFEEMAAVHGSFYLLRVRLKEEQLRLNSVRCEYYFSAPRPDSLRCLVDRIEQAEDGNVVEPVAAWAMLLWVIQICSDHREILSAKKLSLRAKCLLNGLLLQKPLSTLEPVWLEWAERMFLCAPGQESGVARHFVNTKDSN
ncbi:phospholipase D-like domain-containing protein [Paucibacter sp. B2R-40]|uniref:phospholipase D-like domain-containing protein n=1 Tax=Paucibacter sp. B2R-40 TaxID=2893554 RepID=UPI0021E3D90A|nr:phospholipase D-like domain-containing protein [Paucibacter sp. B2R-40]MCV2356554.1 phospholipase D-like domain-containing protein [Paucibacter sp. B2R-40]